jgi:chromosome segregation ATPase
MELKMSELEQKIGDDQCRSEEFLAKIEQLESANKQLSAQLDTISIEMKEKDDTIFQLKQSIESLNDAAVKSNDSYESQRNGFVEELNQMNDALKQRGELITKLEDKCKLAAGEAQVCNTLE